jgi:hypothetical protein
MSCEIIQFSTAARVSPKRHKHPASSSSKSRSGTPAMKGNHPQPPRTGGCARSAMRFGIWPTQRRGIGAHD